MLLQVSELPLSTVFYSQSPSLPQEQQTMFLAYCLSSRRISLLSVLLMVQRKYPGRRCYFFCEVLDGALNRGMHTKQINKQWSKIKLLLQWSIDKQLSCDTI